MARRTNLHGLNIIDLMTELMRRKVPKPGLRRYKFKPMAPQRAQIRTFAPQRAQRARWTGPRALPYVAQRHLPPSDSRWLLDL